MGQGKVRVGISGWTFPGWDGTFYPADLPKKRQLEFASRCVTSIEINGTFYSLQKPHTFENWHRQTPDGFVFAVKAPQFITHVLRLKNAAEPLANFFASGLLGLQRKLGPVLWQFPPHVMLKDDRFEKFLKQLPHDANAAAELARRHGKKMDGRALTEVSENFTVRHAFEFRHPSFLNPDFLALLKAYDVAFVCAHEGGERAPYCETPTADFIYVRLHGEGARYKKGYPDRELLGWTKKIKGWLGSGLDVFVYFSNEAKVYSPAGATKLLKRLAPKKIAVQKKIGRKSPRKKTA